MPDYVFTNDLGGFIDSHNWRSRVFRISKGDNITDVSKQLGHYSVKLTLDVYDRWIPGKKKEEKAKKHLSKLA